MWSNAWVEYLFYDTDLFFENVLTRNFNIPTPPMKYDFKVKIGDQVMRVNRQMVHIIFSIYKSDYLGKACLDHKDEQLLAWTASDKQNDRLVEKLEIVRDKLLKKKLKESKAPFYKDEWFEFQDEDNVYEQTVENQKQDLNISNDQDDLRAGSQLQVQAIGVQEFIDSYRTKFEDDMDLDGANFVKMTLGENCIDMPIKISPRLSKSPEAEMEELEEDGEEEESEGDNGEEDDEAIEAQLSNRYHSKINSLAADTDNRVSMMVEQNLGQKRPLIREVGDAIDSLRLKLHLNKLNVK